MTEFTFSSLSLLPAYRSSQICYSPDMQSGAQSVASGVRILVVEDEYFVSLEIEAILLEMGCEPIAVVTTAEEAIEIASCEKLDLVLMDIRLAGILDGIQGAREINRRFGVRSLFVTSHSDATTRKRGELADPIGWAPKPFTHHQLKAAITAALKAIGTSRAK